VKKSAKKTVKKRPPVPVVILNRQRRFPLREKALTQRARKACLLLGKRLPPNLDAITLVFVTPGESSRLHFAYMNDRTPTDVITFDHGEIIICPSVASRQRLTSGLSLHEELVTYLCHGLLHLSGQNDLTPPEFQAMARAQDKLRLATLH
jgi:probable rRNA maturation factor